MSDWLTELDKLDVEIPCPNPSPCSKKIKASIGRLKQDPKLRCPACHFEFTIDAKQFRKSMDEIKFRLSDKKTFKF